MKWESSMSKEPLVSAVLLWLTYSTGVRMKHLGHAAMPAVDCAAR